MTRGHWHTLAAGVALVLVAFLIHQNVIVPRDRAAIYPWSSDAWGHLVKAEYLRAEIGEGTLYPDIFPAWYAGQQMLRYFAPLPYYLLAGLDFVAGNLFVAGNMFIFLTSAAGALGFLLFSRRIGLVPALMAGVFFLLFPDNLRVAYAEGNLPRLLASAFVPYTTYFVVNLLSPGARRRDFVGATLTMSLVVLSHAMMAGIFAFGLGVLILFYWLVAQPAFRVPARAGLALVSGLLLSGWWLFPSLTGGITEIDQVAASEAIASFPLTVVLNPGIRSSDHEIFYLGLVPLGVTAVSLFFWRHLTPWQRALAVSGIVMSLIASTLVNDVWKALPLSNLFWPIRFLSFAGVALAISAASFIALVYRRYGQRPDGTGRFARMAAVGAVVLVLFDAAPSVALAHGREEPRDITEISRKLASLDGWRVATADLSRLGSAPAQLFTSLGGREQVFGWAFQGSTIAPLLARINEAIVRDHPAYALSRLGRLGADDVVVAPVPEIAPSIRDRLLDAGYSRVLQTPSGTLFHRDGRPRAVVPPSRVLGIGTGAANAAYLFPEISVGSSAVLDSYDAEFLARFDVLVLSRFEVDSRRRAEKLIVDFASRGRRVVVDLTAAPLDPLAREPRFLGVYGEPAIGIKRAVIDYEGASRSLQPFPERIGDVAIPEWRGVAVQGADEELVHFDYAAARGALIARNRYGEGYVEFIGLNLMFHAAVTKDPLAVEVLERSLGLTAFEAPSDREVPLEGYVASDRGYRFEVEVPREEWLLLPFGQVDGTRVFVDGRPTDIAGIESLTLARVPAGRHAVTVAVTRTGVYRLGLAASAAGLALLIWQPLGGPRRSDPVEPARTDGAQPA
jgi:uncharacterized membrane protein